VRNDETVTFKKICSWFKRKGHLPQSTEPNARQHLQSFCLLMQHDTMRGFLLARLVSVRTFQTSHNCTAVPLETELIWKLQNL